MARIDLSKFKDLPTIGFQPFGKVIMDYGQHPKWDIPPKIGIIVAPTGAFVTRDQKRIKNGPSRRKSKNLFPETFTPLESPAARSGDDGCCFFSEHGV